jgi:hypothetical protein
MMGRAVALVPVVGLRWLGVAFVLGGVRQDVAEDLVEIAAALRVAVQFPSRPDSSPMT